MIHAILGVDPPPVSPPALGRIVGTCLAKDPNERFRSAHDVAVQLRWIATGSDSSEAERPPARRQALLPIVAVAVGALGAWVLGRSRAELPRPPIHVTVDLPEDAPVFPTTASTVAISPDGTRIVYPSILAQQGLMMRRLDASTPARIPNTDGGIAPFFSPDGAWIGFWANGNLKKVPVDGGGAITICRTSQLFGATWSDNDTIYFGSEDHSEILRVQASGGEPEPFTEVEGDDVAHRWPATLPDGRGILFAVASELGDWTQARIEVQSLDSLERKSVLEGGTVPRFVSAGYLVFTRDQTLMATRFNLADLVVEGTPVAVREEVLTTTAGRAHYDVSESGTLVYLRLNLFAQRTLVWAHRDGTVEPLSFAPRGFEFPRISPDGTQVALTIREEGSQSVSDIWVAGLDRGSVTRLTFDSEEQETAIWKGEDTLTYAASRGSQFARETVEKAADGSGSETPLSTTEQHHHLGSWTPDEQTLVTDEFGENWDIWITSLADQTQAPFLQTNAVEWGARLSPDGRFLAYESNESGRAEVYVQAFPGPGGKWQISNEGGTAPVWSSNGKELFFRNAESMLAVDFETGPAVRPGSPRLLFRGAYASMPWGSANYDVHPDGERFLMIQGADTTPTKLNLTLNWFEELKRLVPTDE